ncbi:hypothetical protein J4227_07885 [Candidatus Woesearchaeota archaeon]|nr:hypothetical protein [Candidatus Woesearchaeota archaeon]
MRHLVRKCRQIKVKMEMSENNIATVAEKLLEYHNLAYAPNAVSPQHLQSSLGFIERQLMSHPEYGLNELTGSELERITATTYRANGEDAQTRTKLRSAKIWANYLADAIYFYRILNGEQEIVSSDANGGKKMLVQTTADLAHLKDAGADQYFWSDPLLHRARSRRINSASSKDAKELGIRLPTYSGMIDDVAQDPEIKKKYGESIDFYKTFIGRRKGMKAPKPGKSEVRSYNEMDFGVMAPVNMSRRGGAS